MSYPLKKLDEGIDRAIAHCMATGEAPVGFVLHKVSWRDTWRRARRHSGERPPGRPA